MTYFVSSGMLNINSIDQLRGSNIPTDYIVYLSFKLRQYNATENH